MTPAPARSSSPRAGRRGLVVWVGICLVIAVVGSVALAFVRSRDDTMLTVNGWHLDRTAFAGQLDQIAANRPYLDARAKAGTPIKVFRDGSTTEFDSSFVVEFLNERVTFALAEAEVERRGLPVTVEDRQQATQTILANLAAGDRELATATGTTPPGTAVANPAILDGFGSYRDVLVDGVTHLIVLQRDLTKGRTGDDALRQLYEQVKDEYANQACVRDLQVNVGEASVDAAGNPRTPTDQETAAALERILDLRAQLEAGADFATLARQASDDPTTRDAGGDLGCAPKGTYNDALEAAIWSQPVGVVGAPVKSELAYHLILVTDRRLFGFDEVKDKLRLALDRQTEAELQDWITNAAKRAVVIVDPGVGRWNPASGVIEPPEAVNLGLVPDTGGTVPPPGAPTTSGG